MIGRFGRTCRLSGHLALVAGGLGASLAPQDPPASFRATADLVRVEVSVQRRSRPVTGLAAADFEVRDNGVLQRVVSLEYGRLPIDLTIALDVSGSVSGGTIDQLRRAIHDLMRDLAPQDRLRLLLFDSRIVAAADFGASAAEIEAAFTSVQPAGGTAVFDAMAVALAAPPDPDRRQLAVFFTDGEDEDSTTTRAELLETARHTTPTIGMVLASDRPWGAQSATANASGRTIYEQLATETGGFLRTVAPGQSLASAFRQILADFRQSYVIYFSPANIARTGFHELDVRVRGNDVEVHARRNYTAR